MKIKNYYLSTKKIFHYLGVCWYYGTVGILIIISSLTLYYSNLPWQIFNIILVIIYLITCYYGLIKNTWSKSMMGLWWLGLIGIWFFYNLTTQPSNEREWRADMELPARLIVDDNKINIINYRKSGFNTEDGFIPYYTEREVSLSNLTSVDFYISYWMPGPVAHTFIGFNFDDGPPVVVSIEARYEKHESYAPIASLFRQFELIYVIGDEKDIVDSRVNYRKEDVYKYRLNISAESAQRLFKHYVYRINELADYPEFYNLLKSNCTINIFRYANQVGFNGDFDIRILLNGFSDRYLYNVGLIDNSKPFREIKSEAYIQPNS